MELFKIKFLNLFYKILIKNNAFADVFYGNTFVCAMDWSKLGFGKIDRSKPKDVFRNVGKPSGVGSGG